MHSVRSMSCTDSKQGGYCSPPEPLARTGCMLPSSFPVLYVPITSVPDWTGVEFSQPGPGQHMGAHCFHLQCGWGRNRGLIPTENGEYK